DVRSQAICRRDTIENDVGIARAGTWRRPSMEDVSFERRAIVPRIASPAIRREPRRKSRTEQCQRRRSWKAIDDEPRDGHLQDLSARARADERDLLRLAVREQRPIYLDHLLHLRR